MLAQPRSRTVTATVTELLLHMAAPRTCLGAGDHLGLDAHLRQVGDVNLAAVGGARSPAPLNARLAPILSCQPAEHLGSTSEPSLPPSAFGTASFSWLIGSVTSSRCSESLGTPPALLWLLTCAWLSQGVSQADSWLAAQRRACVPRRVREPRASPPPSPLCLLCSLEATPKGSALLVARTVCAGPLLAN